MRRRNKVAPSPAAATPSTNYTVTDTYYSTRGVRPLVVVLDRSGHWYNRPDAIRTTMIPLSTSSGSISSNDSSMMLKDRSLKSFRTVVDDTESIQGSELASLMATSLSVKDTRPAAILNNISNANAQNLVHRGDAAIIEHHGSRPNSVSDLSESGSDNEQSGAFL